MVQKYVGIQTKWNINIFVVQMREIKAFSKYLKNYKSNIGLNVVFNILYVIFSVFSLTIVMPFLDIIFHPDKGVNQAPEFAFSIDALKDYLNYVVTLQIEQYSSREAGLIFLAIAITSIFFLKNLFRFLAQYFLAPIRNGVVRDIRIQLNKTLEVQAHKSISIHRLQLQFLQNPQ